MYKELLEAVFNFSNVEIVLNPTKAEMIEKLAQLKAEAEVFHKSHQPRRVYSFVLVHVGFTLNWMKPHHDSILEDRGIEYKEGKDGSIY